MTKITVTKLDAAHRQLRTAIVMWFENGDPVSMHTLACAAHQIINDRLYLKSGKPVLAFDLSMIKVEYRSAIRAELKLPFEFMKHGDNRGAGKLPSISFDPDLTEAFILFAIMGLDHLKESRTVEEQAFDFWHRIHRPEIFLEAWQAALNNKVDAQTLAGLRAIPKDKFLESVRDMLRRYRPW